jgi:hydroxymethylbilane synthase
MAVHSMKDVPTRSQEGLGISCVLKRADPRDAFISVHYANLMDLPANARVGTASIRRQAQALRVRPDLRFTLLRGNVGTRLQKLADGECDATFLAAAGLKRLGREGAIRSLIPTSHMLPAPAQGAIGIETRLDDAVLKRRLRPLHHNNSYVEVMAERAFLRALDGSCRTPIAALATITSTDFQFHGQAFTPEGKTMYERRSRISLGDSPLRIAVACGQTLGKDIAKQAGDNVRWTDSDLENDLKNDFEGKR